MGDSVSLFPRATEGFGARVRSVGNDQWALSTPCSDWNVRQLVNHLVSEELWAAPLLAGRTIAEVGDQYDGDVLGDDPLAAWTAAAAAATAAAAEPGAGDRTVHLSFGDFSGRDYLGQLVSDHAIHAWDLARAVGADEDLDPDVVDFVYDFLVPQVEGWRAAGVFGPAQPAPEGAGRQARLLALSGRSA